MSEAVFNLAKAISAFREAEEKNRQRLNAPPEVLLMTRNTYQKLCESVPVSNHKGDPSVSPFALNFYGIRIETFDTDREMKLRAIEFWNTGMKVAMVTEEGTAESGDGH